MVEQGWVCVYILKSFQSQLVLNLPLLSFRPPSLAWPSIIIKTKQWDLLLFRLARWFLVVPGSYAIIYPGCQIDPLETLSITAASSLQYPLKMNPRTNGRSSGAESSFCFFLLFETSFPVSSRPMFHLWKYQLVSPTSAACFTCVTYRSPGRPPATCTDHSGTGRPPEWDPPEFHACHTEEHRNHFNCTVVITV